MSYPAGLRIFCLLATTPREMPGANVKSCKHTYAGAEFACKSHSRRQMLFPAICRVELDVVDSFTPHPLFCDFD